jgi:hypothetical protein
MRVTVPLTIIAGSLAIGGVSLHVSLPLRSYPVEVSMNATTIEIPKSVQIEHQEIHSLLVEATQAPGRVGAAAKALAEVLHPHFVREEEIALPPLGLLAPLAAGALPAEWPEALAMTDSLRAELSRMLTEHKRIRAAVEDLRKAAMLDHAVKYERLADQLALHAQTEEEVLYPAAVLVGEVIRLRQRK